MAQDTPAPAEQAVGSGKSDLASDEVAPQWFIPQATQDNYAQIARDQASIRDVEPKAVMSELADQWLQMHERQPLDGYDHLAAWAKDFDPAVGGAPTGLAVLQARALESARRDPYQAVIGDQALVQQGVAAQHTLDERAAAVGASPSVDPSSGLLPNPGPLPIPADVASGPDSGGTGGGDQPPTPPDDSSAATPSHKATGSKSTESGS